MGAAAAPKARSAAQPSGGCAGGTIDKNKHVPLVVSGCASQTISEIVQGTYHPYSFNHGKVVYKKQEKEESSSLDVLIYYWEDREDPELSGWWFGPNVGGEMV